MSGLRRPLTAVDIDQDGNLDIVSSTKVLFLNNFTLVDSYNIPASFAPSSWQISIPFDYDSDGDLDVIVKKAYGILDGGNSVQTDVLTNLWEPDDDGDGYPNSVDLCLNTPDGLDVNSFGCASIEYDTDGDGSLIRLIFVRVLSQTVLSSAKMGVVGNN